MALFALLKKSRTCAFCDKDLPLDPRPTISMHPSARIIIVGQAPGAKVHETGIAWTDPSGQRLRDWMQVDRDIFYDPSRIAIMPMGLCYPGGMVRGGDKPPARNTPPPGTAVFWQNSQTQRLRFWSGFTRKAITWATERKRP